MPCGTYPYKYLWECRAGRLKQLNTQSKPNATRDYGSEGARARAIRRRTAAKIRTNPPADPGIRGGNDRAWPNARAGVSSQYNGRQAYGPLFGEKRGPGSGPCACTPNAVQAAKDQGRIYRAQGGTSSDVTYWKRVHGGSIQLLPACWGCASDTTLSPARAAKCNFLEVASGEPVDSQCAAKEAAAFKQVFVSLENWNARRTSPAARNAGYFYFPKIFEPPSMRAARLGALPQYKLTNWGTVERCLGWPKPAKTVGASMRVAGGPTTTSGYTSASGGGPPPTVHWISWLRRLSAGGSLMVGKVQTCRLHTLPERLSREKRVLCVNKGQPH